MEFVIMSEPVKNNKSKLHASVLVLIIKDNIRSFLFVLL
jgi:hypothetical protein